MAGTMRCGDYTAIIEFDERTDLFRGRVAGIGTPIIFSGKTVDELRAGFQSSVAAYLADCEARGATPERLYKGSFNVRIDPELHRDAVVAAGEDGITLNAFVERAIARAIRRHKRIHAHVDKSDGE